MNCFLKPHRITESYNVNDHATLSIIAELIATLDAQGGKGPEFDTLLKHLATLFGECPVHHLQEPDVSELVRLSDSCRLEFLDLILKDTSLMRFDKPVHVRGAEISAGQFSYIRVRH